MSVTPTEETKANQVSYIPTPVPCHGIVLRWQALVVPPGSAWQPPNNPSITRQNIGVRFFSANVAPVTPGTYFCTIHAYWELGPGARKLGALTNTGDISPPESNTAAPGGYNHSHNIQFLFACSGSTGPYPYLEHDQAGNQTCRDLHMTIFRLF